jgi:hypothetical protein
MNESPSPSDRTLTPILTGGVQIALVFASWALLSVFLNRDVIPDPAVGPLIGPIAVAFGGAVTALAVRRSLAGPRPPLAISVVAGLVAGMGMVAAVSIGSAVGHGDVAWLLIGASAALIAPFAPAMAVLTVSCVLGGWGVARADLRDTR